MRVIKPVAVTESTYSSSSIPEIDSSRGEVQWLDPAVPHEVYVPTASPELKNSKVAFSQNENLFYVLANDSSGAGYQIRSFSSQTLEYSAVLYADTVTQTSNAVFEVVGDYAYLATDGNVIKFDVATFTPATIGTYTGLYSESFIYEGEIYCAGNMSVNPSGEQVMIIDTTTDTVSFTGSVAQGGRVSSIAMNNEFVLYFVCDNALGGDAPFFTYDLKEDTPTLTFAANLSSFNCADAQGYGDKIYCACGTSLVIINADNSESTAFNLLPYAQSAGDRFRHINLLVDGLLYISTDDVMIAFNTEESTAEIVTIGGSNHLITHTATDGSSIVGGGYNYTDDQQLFKHYRPFYYDGDIVALESTKRLYYSTRKNQDNPVDGLTKTIPTWIDYGSTNKWAAFDDKINTVSKWSSPLTFEFTPGEFVTAISGFNITGVSSINVTMTDPIDGEVYNEDFGLTGTSNVYGWYTYYFSAIQVRTFFIATDVPPYKDATITVTLTGPGEISVGALPFGDLITIGNAEYGANVKMQDLSRNTEDEFGNVTVIRRESRKLTEFPVKVLKSRMDYVYSIMDDLRTIPSVWVGEGTQNDITVTYGYHYDLVLNVNYPSVCDVTIQVKGLI